MKRKIFSILFVLVLVLSLSLVTAAPASAQVTLTVTGDGNEDVDYPGEVDQHISIETIDASLGPTLLSGTVDISSFAAGPADRAWYEVGLVSNTAYETVTRLHNKGVYMIALYDGENYKVHIQNVPGTTPSEGYFTVTNPVFDFELTYHNVTVDSGQVDLRVNDGTGWAEPITYTYAEDDVEVFYGLTHQEAIDLGYAADDDLTNARIISQLFTGGFPESGGFEFTAVYDNIKINNTTAINLTTTILEAPEIVAVSVTPTSIDFGTLYPGQSSGITTVTVENVGSVTIDVEARVDPTGKVFDNLLVGGLAVPTTDLITGLAGGTSSDVNAQLVVPSDYTPKGLETATLVFEATATAP